MAVTPIETDHDYQGVAKIIRALFNPTSADPGSPANGEIWYNTTDHALRFRVNGVTETFTSTNALNAAAVLKSLFNANTVLAATNDNDPQPVTLGASTVLGRGSSGNIAAISYTDLLAALVTLGINANALSGQSLAYVLNRDNHTSNQPASTISDFDSAVDGRILLHTGDTTDAHDASAISFTPTGSISATDVQAAIAEVAAEAAGSGGPPNLILAAAPTGTAATDRATISDAFNAAVSGSYIMFQPGEYNLGVGALEFTSFGTLSDVVVDWNGAVFASSSNLSSSTAFPGFNPLLVITGAKAASVDTQASIAAGVTSFTAVSAGLSAGDLIVVGSNDTHTPQRPVPQHCRGEFARVAAYSSPTVTLESPLLDSYSTTPKLHKYTPITRLRLINPAFKFTGGTTRSVGLVVMYAEDLRIEGTLRIDGGNVCRVGAYLLEIDGLTIDAIDATDVADSNGTLSTKEGYPIYGIGVRNAVVSQVNAYRCRHAFDFGSFRSGDGGATPYTWRPITRNVVVEKVSAHRCWSAGLSTHAGTEDVVIDKSYLYNCGGGYRIRNGGSTVVSNLEVHGSHYDLDPHGDNESYEDGGTFGEPLSGGSGTNYTGIAGSNVRVEKFNVDMVAYSGSSGRFTHGLAFEDPTENLVITQGKITGFQAAAIYLNGLTNRNVFIENLEIDAAEATAGSSTWPAIVIAAGSANVQTSQTATPDANGQIETIRIRNIRIKNWNKNIAPIRIMGGQDATAARVTRRIIIEDIEVVSGSVSAGTPLVEFHDGFVDDVTIRDIKGLLTTTLMSNDGGSATITNSALGYITDGDKGDIVITSGVWDVKDAVIDARVAVHTGDATDAHAASAITNTPAGGIAATTVQAALNELDGDKAAAVHTHTSTSITDFNTAVDARVTAGIATVIDTAPAALDTLNELAAAIGDDPNFAATMTTSLGNKTENFNQNFGNGAANSFDFTHGFATIHVLVQVFRNSTGAEVLCGVEVIDANTVRITTVSTPALNAYRVEIVGRNL